MIPENTHRRTLLTAAAGVFAADDRICIGVIGGWRQRRQPVPGYREKIKTKSEPGREATSRVHRLPTGKNSLML